VDDQRISWQAVCELGASRCSAFITALSIDKAVIKAVGMRLADTLDWLFPGQKTIMDEHVSSGNESSDDEEKSTAWRQRVTKDAKIHITY
jgi:hypothetical protein